MSGSKLPDEGSERPLPTRPNVILEDIDAIEARRRAVRDGKRGGAPGTLEDPRLYRRLASYIRPYWGSLALALVISAVSAAAKVGLVFVVEQVLQPMFRGAGQVDLGRSTLTLVQRLGPISGSWWSELWASIGNGIDLLRWTVDVAEPLLRLRWASMTLVGLVVLAQVNKYGQKLLMRAVSLDVVRTVRKALFERLMTLSMRFFHANHSGKLLSRLTNDLNMLGNLLVDIMVHMFTDLFTVIGALWYVWAKGGSLVIVGLALAAVTFIPVQALGRRIRSREQKNRRKMAKVFQSLTEALSSQKVVKAFGAQEYETARFSKVNDQFAAGRMRSIDLQARTEPLVEVLGALGVAGFLYVGGKSVLEGRWEGAAFFAIVLALFQSVASLRRLSDTSTKLQGGLSSADRVATLLYSEPEIVDAPDAVTLDGFHQGIEFDHVWYAHSADRNVLEDVHFKLPKGSTLALVGHTGSGKSTIGDLLPRFYDVDRGAVRIDGHDVRDVKLASLREQIAMVTQETVLFQGTIASNIAYARTDAPLEDIQHAARAANIHDFIEQLPQGYDTPVGERGWTLSGGERQRVAIARALLRDAPILILDEATSALDTRSERLVQAAIDNLKVGRTTLLIAHRLSTIRDADQILVLDQGRIAERGSHEELLAHDGLYAQLIRMQHSQA